MNIHTDVTNFLKKQAPKGVSFSDQDNLLTKGVIDSLKMLDLTSFMQEQFDLTIDEDEMMPDNFESVNAIVAFVTAKRKSVAA